MSIPFSLRQVEYFCAVAQAGSFAAASDATFVSRSALAAAIDDLESTLGVKLFVRNRAQGTRLTPAGREMLDHSLTLLDDADSILGLNAPASGLAGRLSVGCYPSLAPTVLGHLWRLCAATYPNVSLAPVSADLDDMLRRLKSGELDLIVSFGIESHADLDTLELYPTIIHAVLSSSHHLAEMSVVEARDLAREDLLLMGLSPAKELTLEYFKTANIEPNISQAIDNYELVRSLVALGAGYSLAAQRPSVDKSYEGQSLVMRPLHPAPKALPVSIGWLKGRGLPRVAQAFVRLAHQQADNFASSAPAEPGGPVS